MAMDLAKIEDRLNKTAAGAVAISSEVGGIQFQTMLEVMEFAKLMALSQAAVPSHLRGNPGACLAISIQALEWKMSPFAVANKSYLVNNKGEERIAYESQLLHAIIEARAPLQGRLRFEILGEGDDRRCKVYGTFKGETEPHIYISETLGKLRDARGRNDYGKLKGSPLWDTQPEVQLFYSASRQWGRLYCPDTILGIYTPEELDNQGPDHAKDINPRPDVASRLKGNKGRGFSASHVDRETRGGVIDSGATDAQHQPDRAATMAEPTDGGSDAPMEGESPSTISNSSQASPQAHLETDKPASVSPADAGNHSETEVQRETAGKPLPLAQSGDEPRASEQESVTTGSGEAHDRVSESASPTLPDGWGIEYAGALRRAQKKESLSKYATQFWAQYGSWADHKNGPNAQTAIAIYLAFEKNFGNKDAIEAVLRELV